MTPADPVLEPRDAALWDLLIENIAEGTVVPIVGRDLLSTGDEPDSPNLHVVLATQLAKALQVPFDGSISADVGPLNAVAAEHILRGGEPDDIYRTLSGIMRARGPSTISAPLRKLAAIDRFSLFLTTTFDDMLERAIEAARGTAPRVLSFSVRSQSTADFTPADQPTVYHLFGRLSSLPDYVVTEEDALEFVILLLSSRNQPAQLLHELSRRNLLIIGCSFPSWFVRFFLRLSRGRRLLWATRDNVAFVVDAGARQDAGLLQFLKAFRTRTEVFTQYGAVDFVDELAVRWTARSGETAPAPAVMKQDAIFVSYASEDRARALAIVESLQRSGLEVWFDREQLQSGDNWDDKIRSNVERASAFIPIISQQALAGTRRYFLDEWRQAVEASRRIAFNDTFLFPLAIDDVDAQSDAIPREFRAAQWTKLVSDEVPSTLVTALNDAVRRKKMSQRR